MFVSQHLLLLIFHNRRCPLVPVLHFGVRLKRQFLSWVALVMVASAPVFADVAVGVFAFLFVVVVVVVVDFSVVVVVVFAAAVVVVLFAAAAAVVNVVAVVFAVALFFAAAAAAAAAAVQVVNVAAVVVDVVVAGPVVPAVRVLPVQQQKTESRDLFQV